MCTCSSCGYDRSSPLVTISAPHRMGAVVLLRGGPSLYGDCFRAFSHERALVVPSTTFQLYSQYLMLLNFCFHCGPRVLPHPGTVKPSRKDSWPCSRSAQLPSS
jgi:hypothetical protein